MRRELEWQAAAKRLKGCLEAKGHTASCEPGPDPPDVIFQVDGARWGVEHTRLFQYVDGEGVELSRQSVDAQACRLENWLSQRTEGLRKRSWLVCLIGPLNSEQLKAIREPIAEAIIRDDRDYLFEKDPRWLERNQFDLIPLGEDDECFVGVLSELSLLSTIPESGRPTFDIQGEIDYQVRRAVKKKVPRLEAISEYDKRVLLLESEYSFTTPANVARSLRSHVGLSMRVDLIFLVTGESVTRVGGWDEGFSWRLACWLGRFLRDLDQPVTGGRSVSFAPRPKLPRPG